MVGTLSTGVTGVPGVRGDTLPLPLALLEKSRGWFSSGGVRKLERGKDCLVGVILASIWSIVSPGQTDHDCGHRTPLPPETAGHTYGSLRAAPAPYKYFKLKPTTSLLFPLRFSQYLCEMNFSNKIFPESPDLNWSSNVMRII